MLLSNFNFTVYMGFPLIKNTSRIFRLLVSRLYQSKKYLCLESREKYNSDRFGGF